MSPPNKRPLRESQPAAAESVSEHEALGEAQVIDLPAREAMSIVDPGIFGVGIPIGRIADQPPLAADISEPTPPST